MSLFERLEPRRLMTAYVGQTIADYFHLSGMLLENLTPPAGTVYDDFGATACALGDLDGDGFREFAISAPGRTGADGSTEVAGAVFVFSGKTGAHLRTLSDGFSDFGRAMSSLGDINRDGKADLLVGSPNFDALDNGIVEHYGRAYVFSGADGAPLLTLDGSGPSDEFGFSVIIAGDRDSDGVSDLAVGAPGAGAGGEGAVYLFAGANGARLKTYSGEHAGDRFGHAIFSPAAVVDRPPNYPNMLWITAPLNDDGGPDAGRVYGFDRTLNDGPWTADGQAGDRFGTALVAVAHFEYGAPRDPLLFIGAPGADVVKDGGLLIDAGAVRAVSGGLGSEPSPVAAGGAQGELLGSGLRLATPRNVLVSHPGRPGDAFSVLPNPESGFDITGLRGRAFYLGDLDNDGFFDLVTAEEGTSTMVVRSGFTLSPLPSLTSSNDNLTFAYSNSGNGEGTAIVNGRYLLYSRIPGLQKDDVILGVNNAQTIVGRGRGTVPPFIVRDGTRTLLPDAITSIKFLPGHTRPPAYENFGFVGIANSGVIVFNEWLDDVNSYSLWSLSDGVLTLVAIDASGVDVNSSGVILAGAGMSGGVAQYRLYQPDGSFVVVVDEPSPFRPAHVGDSGAVVGYYASPDLRPDVALWRDGRLTVLTSAVTLPPPVADFYGQQSYRPSWSIQAIDSRSRVLLSLNYATTYQTWAAEAFVFDPAAGLRDLESVTFGYYKGAGGFDGYYSDENTPIALGDDGVVLLTRAVAAPASDSSYWQPADGSPISTSAGSDLYTVIVNRHGDAVLMSRTAGGWAGTRIKGMTFAVGGGQENSIRQSLLFVNPATGEEEAFLVTPSGTYHASIVDLWDKWRVSTDPVVGIVDHAAVFVSQDRRVHLAGIDAAGDLLLYYQTNSFSWAVSDLTTDHLQAAGKTFVPVAGDLTAFATRWNGMNIAYLDASGHVQTVWWAPGLARWTIDDLSMNIGGVVPALHGTLVSYVTPWGGLNVAGTDADGNLVALWWAPGLKKWRSDRLVGGTPAELDESTITGFATPWGGLNVVGLNKATGKLTAYWWAPGKPTWIVEEFTITNAPADLALKGRVGSAVSPDGRMFIGAVTGQDHLANIWIGPETGLKWTFEDVTAEV